MSWVSEWVRAKRWRVGYSKLSEVIYYLFPPPDKIPLNTGDSLTPPLTYSFIVMAGLPGTGKTTLALSIAAEAERVYSGAGLTTETVIASDAYTAFRRASSDIVTVIIDDADIAHPSTMIDYMLLDAINRFRHTLSSQRVRYAIIIFITHRWKRLSMDIRTSAGVIIFKSIFMDPQDNRELKGFIGGTYFDILREITRGIFFKRDMRYASLFVYKTAWGKKSLGYLPKKARPTNIVDVRGERSEKEEVLGIEDVIMELIERGWSWAKIRRYALPVLRAAGFKIDTNAAYKLWKEIQLLYESSEPTA